MRNVTVFTTMVSVILYREIALKKKRHMPKGLTYWMSEVLSESLSPAKSHQRNEQVVMQSYFINGWMVDWCLTSHSAHKSYMATRRIVFESQTEHTRQFVHWLHAPYGSEKSISHWLRWDSNPGPRSRGKPLSQLCLTITVLVCPLTNGSYVQLPTKSPGWAFSFVDPGSITNSAFSRSAYNPLIDPLAKNDCNILEHQWIVECSEWRRSLYFER